MRPEKQVKRKNPTAPNLGADSGAGLGVTPAHLVNRRIIADARRAKMLMEYASMSAQVMREAFEQGDMELAEFARGLTRFCLSMSNYFLTRYFGDERWW